MNSRLFNAWALTAAAAVLMAITTGSRSTFGLFVSPLNTATGLGLATISLAGAISQLGWGVVQPFVGAVADRYGAARVIGIGGIATAVATALVTVADSAVGLVGAFALLAFATAAMGSGALLLAAVNRDAPVKWRGLAAGIVGAGASLGQLVLAPAVQATITASGWIAAMYGLAGLALFGVPLAWAFKRQPAAVDTPAPTPAPAKPAAASPDVRDALRTPSFWLVTGGFFVCGFHVSFLVAHMPGQIELCGFPAQLSGVWIAIVGVCNVVGSLASGAAIRWIPAKRLLIALYALRAVGVATFVALPKTELTVLAFAVWMGLTYMATLAPTSALIDKLFGTARFAMLFGVVMLVHQVGAFFGVWLGGVALEAAGSFDWIWYADIAIAIVAAALHLPLREADGQRQEQAAARPAGELPAAMPGLRLAATRFELADGRAVTIRAIVPADRDGVQALVRGLTAESRRRRFFSSIRELSDAMLQRLTHPDPAREQVLVAEVVAGHRRRIVGLAQLAPDGSGEACEVAFVVADDIQGQGLGTRMMAALVEAAYAAGFREVVGDVLRDNRAMLALARRAGFAMRSSRDPLLTRIVRSLRDRSGAGGPGPFPARAAGATFSA
jgi:MFS family permease